MTFWDYWVFFDTVLAGGRYQYRMSTYIFVFSNLSYCPFSSKRCSTEDKGPDLCSRMAFSGSHTTAVLLMVFCGRILEHCRSVMTMPTVDVRNSLRLHPEPHFFGDNEPIYESDDDHMDASAASNTSAISFNKTMQSAVTSSSDSEDETFATPKATSTPKPRKRGLNLSASMSGPSTSKKKPPPHHSFSRLVLDESDRTMAIAFFSIRFFNLFRNRQGHFCW